MAAGFVKENTVTGASTAATSGTYTVTAPAAGNLLVACIALGSSTAGAQVSSLSSTGATWTNVARSAQNGTGNNRQEIWVGTGDTGTTVTINFSASSKWSASISEWSGLETTVDVTAVTSTGSVSNATNTTTSTGLSTPGGDLIIGAMNLATSKVSTDFSSTSGSPDARTALTYSASGATTSSNVGMQAVWDISSNSFTNETFSWVTTASWQYAWAAVSLRAKARNYNVNPSMTGTVSYGKAPALALTTFSSTLTQTVSASKTPGKKVGAAITPTTISALDLPVRGLPSSDVFICGWPAGGTGALDLPSRGLPVTTMSAFGADPALLPLLVRTPAHALSSTITGTVAYAKALVLALASFAATSTLAPGTLAPAAAKTDTFVRADQSGSWGTASDGETWGAAGYSAPTLAISGNAGTMIGATQGLQYGVRLGGSIANPVEGLGRFSLQDTLAQFGLDIGSGSIRALLNYSGGQLQLSVSDTQTTTGAGLGLLVSDEVWIRVRVLGGRGYVRAWKDGTTEPTTWTITKAVVGGGGNSNMDVNVYWLYQGAAPSTASRVDSITVTPLQPLPKIPAKTLTTATVQAVGSALSGAFGVAKALSATCTVTISRSQQIVHLLGTFFVPSSTALSHAGWTASSSHNTTDAHYAIDGDITTRWTSAATQSPGMTFTVDLGQQRVFSSILLDARASNTDSARGYDVAVSNDGSSWGSTIATCSSSCTNAYLTISFAQQTARYIRVTQTGTDPTWWWSIDEFSVFPDGAGLAKTLSRALAGTCTATVSLIRQVAHALAATCTGTISRSQQIVHTTAATITGTISRSQQIAHTIAATISGAVSRSQDVASGLAASVSGTGSYAKTATRVLGATCTGTVSRSQLTAHTLVATMSGAPSLARGIARTLAAQIGQTVSFTAGLTGSATHYTVALAASSALAAMRLASTAHGLLSSLGGNALQQRSVGAAQSASLGGQASLRGSATKAVVALLGATSRLSRALPRTFAASISSSVLLGRGRYQSLSASITSLASFSRNPGLVFMAACRLSSLLLRAVLHQLRPGIPLSAAVPKAMARPLAASISGASRLLRHAMLPFAAQLGNRAVLVRASVHQMAAHSTGPGALLRRSTRPFSAQLPSRAAQIGFIPRIRLVLRAGRLFAARTLGRSAALRSARSTQLVVPTPQRGLRTRRLTALVAKRLVREDPQQMIAVPARADSAGLYVAPHEQNVGFTIDMTAALPTGVHVSSATVLSVMARWPNQNDDAAITHNEFAAGPGVSSNVITLVVGDGTQVEGMLYTVILSCIYNNTPPTTATVYVEIPCSKGAAS